MAKSKMKNLASRKFSDAELLAQFEQNLTTLAHLAKIYDDGYPPICFLMATEIHKMLTENNAAVRLRKTRNFSSVDYSDDSKMLNALHKLTGARISGSPPILDFVPSFLIQDGTTPSLIGLRFVDWWSRDVIYRASAALPGTPVGLIPINNTPSVPFEKREHLNRQQFVSLLRNKLGAHQSDDMPNLLEELEAVRSWSQFIIDTPNGTLSTEDGSLAIGTGIIAAMMRQICHEVLIAYDREDILVLS